MYIIVKIAFVKVDICNVGTVISCIWYIPRNFFGIHLHLWILFKDKLICSRNFEDQTDLIVIDEGLDEQIKIF